MADKVGVVGIINTRYANLHKANAAGKLVWELEYAFKTHFEMDDLSPLSFEALHGRMAVSNSTSWDKYRGQGDGSLYCKSCKNTRPDTSACL